MEKILSEVSIPIHSEKIKIVEENGNIILSPVKEKPNLNELVGMFSDGKLSAEKFIEQKKFENNYPEKFFELFGAIKDDTFIEPDEIAPMCTRPQEQL